MSLQPSERAEVHRGCYKASDAEEGRREDQMVEIQKNRREDFLLKQRREGLPSSAAPGGPWLVVHSSALQKKIQGFVWASVLVGLVPQC